jgi:hypothetical protein
MKKWKQTTKPYANLSTYNKGTVEEAIIGLYMAPLGNVYIQGWSDCTYMQFYYNGCDHREWLDGKKTKLQLARAAGKFYKQCINQSQG